MPRQGRLGTVENGNAAAAGPRWEQRSVRVKAQGGGSPGDIAY